jgi:hypothetical protein
MTEQWLSQPLETNPYWDSRFQFGIGLVEQSTKEDGAQQTVLRETGVRCLVWALEDHAKLANGVRIDPLILEKSQSLITKYLPEVEMNHHSAREIFIDKDKE